MKYCSKCGTTAEDNAGFCTACGTAFESPQPRPQTYYQQQNYQQPTYQTYSQQPVSDEPANGGLCVLSFFIPIVGFVLAAINWNTAPRAAKSYLKASLIPFIIYFAFVVLGILIAVLIPLFGAMTY